MLHPRLTAVGSTTPHWLAEVGDFGSWSDLQVTTRWGDGASGMYEAQWTMPLPPDFDHPLLRRGTLVELMDGSWRVGSPLILSEPARGTSLDDPWQFVATGIGRAVEGENSFYAFDGSGNTTTVPTTAVDQAIVDGWRIAGRDSSVTSTSPTAGTTSDGLNTVGALLSAAAQAAGKRWGVKQDNRLYFMSDPTTPMWQVTPGSAALGVGDDDYASTVKVRYLDLSTGIYKTVTATNTQTANTYGVRQYPVDITDRGAMSSTAAQNIADQVLALYKGRLSWINGLTLATNDLQNMGGNPIDGLTIVEAGQMIRLHGIWDDLLEFNGKTYLDVIIGETRYNDQDPTVIQVNPLGLAPRDLAAVLESVAGPARAA